MTDLLLVILILLVLGVLVFLIVLAKRRGVGDAGEVAELRGRFEAEQAARVQAETRLEGEQKNLAEQRALLAEAEGKLKDAFAALSAEALKDSRQEFLGQAGERLKPIQELLAKYEEQLRQVENARKQDYGGLAEQVMALNKQTTQLAAVLRNPGARGRWGELQLRRVLEITGMLEHCDFERKPSTQTEQGRRGPDVTVKLPNQRTIVVDSKAPIDAYAAAIEAPDEPARQVALARHARAVREHMRLLSQKDYWSQFESAPDFVVLFLPGEDFFRAAIEHDSSLIEQGWEQKVLLASPVILIALCRAVYCGWQEHALAENAEKIADVGRELYERVRVFAENFRDVGSGLRSAAKAYDLAVGSYLSRLEPGARKLAELGASSGKELPEVEGVEGPTRVLPKAGERSGE